MGSSMIWHSIPFMTTVDVLIIAVTVYAIMSGSATNDRPRRKSAFGGSASDCWQSVCFILLILRPCTFCPSLCRCKKQWSLWTLSIAISVGWFLFALIAISTEFIELRPSQIELTEKNELLADLSSKLARVGTGRIIREEHDGSSASLRATTPGLLRLWKQILARLKS
jgi:hypothetical protein